MANDNSLRGVATIVNGTIVQGGSCKWDLCPMKQLSNETFYMLPWNNLFKLDTSLLGQYSMLTNGPLNSCQNTGLRESYIV